MSIDGVIFVTPVDEDSSRALYARRTELVEALSDVDRQIEQRRADCNYHIKGADVAWEEASSWIPSLTAPIKMKGLVMPERGFPVNTFYSFMLQIPPRYRQGKYHIHGEAIKFYLRGRGIEHIGDSTYEVEKGDLVLIPANIWHGTENPYEEPIEIYGVQQMDGHPLPRPVHIASIPDAES